jgi:Transposase, Mutator family
VHLGHRRGVRGDGSKELVALADGHRESTESWADLLRDCRRRSMRAPVLAVGDGALGFWAALREVFPATKEQRCWVHKAANVINCLPKSAQPAARRAIAEIRDAEDRGHAEVAIGQFRELFGAKYPKAVAKIVDDQPALLAFYSVGTPLTSSRRGGLAALNGHPAHSTYSQSPIRPAGGRPADGPSRSAVAFRRWCGCRRHTPRTHSLLDR